MNDDHYVEAGFIENENLQPHSDFEDEEDEIENESDVKSGSATSGSTTPEPVASSLDDAIRAAPVTQLHALLILICRKHESARKLASNRLLTSVGSSIGQKRKAFEKCRDCGEDFNVLTNKKGDCIYHPGEKEENESDFWADHDEDCHGRIEDLVDDPTYDDGFQWTCCERLGGEAGCVRTKHKPDIHEPATKRVRY